MATFERDGAVLHYSEYGSGFRLPWNPVEEPAATHRVTGSASRLIAESVPGATFVERWKDDPSVPATIAEFLT